MTVFKMPALEAYANAGKNKSRTHPTPGRDEQRMVPFPMPEIRAGFTFSPDKDSFFATGSCFARNIENALIKADANTLSSSPDIRVPHEANEAQIRQLYNKYTVHSILNELRWAFGRLKFDPDAHLIEEREGQFVDLQISPSITGTKQQMADMRADYNATFANIAKADVIIMTLGLVECWYDTKTGLYLNAAPSMRVLKRNPERFEFHVLDHADISDALDEIYSIISENRADTPKILVTVSPVALNSTFREQDVLIANCYSKSVQRGAIDGFVSSGRADYFPSYEMVTLSDNRHAWIEDDFVHVRAETVERVIAHVFRAYGGDSHAADRLYASGHATGLIADQSWEEAQTILAAYVEKHGHDTSHLSELLARSSMEIGNFADAESAFLGAAKVNPDKAALLRNLANEAAEKAKVEAVLEEENANTTEDNLNRAITGLKEKLGENSDLLVLLKALESNETMRPTPSAHLGSMQDATRHTQELEDDGAFDELIAFTATALKIWPNVEILRWRRAQAFRSLGRDKESYKEFRHLAALGGSSAEASKRMMAGFPESVVASAA